MRELVRVAKPVAVVVARGRGTLVGDPERTTETMRAMIPDALPSHRPIVPPCHCVLRARVCVPTSDSRTSAPNDLAQTELDLLWGAPRVLPPSSLSPTQDSLQEQACSGSLPIGDWNVGAYWRRPGRCAPRYRPVYSGRAQVSVSVPSATSSPPSDARARREACPPRTEYSARGQTLWRGPPPLCGPRYGEFPVARLFCSSRY